MAHDQTQFNNTTQGFYEDYYHIMIDRRQWTSYTYCKKLIMYVYVYFILYYSRIIFKHIL